MAFGLRNWPALIPWIVVYALVFVLENVALILSLPEISVRAINRPLRRLLARLSAAKSRPPR